MQVQEQIEHYRADALYFEAHRAELLRQYPDRWIAVYDQQVVGTAKNLDRLVRLLQDKGIAPSHAFREYLTEKEDILILPAR